MPIMTATIEKEEEEEKEKRSRRSRGWGYSSAVEVLPSMDEVLGPIASTIKKQKLKKA
jgi:hypothetical protein